MGIGANKKISSLLVIMAVLFFYAPGTAAAESSGHAKLIGTIYAADGSTPLPGAIITANNVDTNDIYTSDETNAKGVFKIENMAKGIYILGVTTADGEFNASNMIGVRSGKTEKVSMTLNHYNTRTQIATHEMLVEQKRNGESLVGRVETYNTQHGIASVYITKGYLQKNDRIHNLYADRNISDTDFRQKVDKLNMEGKEVQRAFAGQTVNIQMKDEVVPGDLVYVACNQGILPLFLSPLGIASVVAGSGVIYGFVDPLDDPPNASPSKK